MEMVCNRLSSYLPCCATVYGNGCQAVLPLMELRLQLETERADRSEIEGELSELKQNSAPAATLLEKLTPDVATILSQLRARRKKSKTDLADLKAILEILQS
jgi:ABC-type transporter Mla subunit MlaD